VKHDVRGINLKSEPVSDDSRTLHHLLQNVVTLMLTTISALQSFSAACPLLNVFDKLCTQREHSTSGYKGNKVLHNLSEQHRIKLHTSADVPHPLRANGCGNHLHEGIEEEQHTDARQHYEEKYIADD